MHGSFLKDEERKEKVRKFLSGVEPMARTLFKQPDVASSDHPEQVGEPVIGHVSPAKQEVTIRVTPDEKLHFVESTPIATKAAVARALAHLETLKKYTTARHLLCHVEAAQKALRSIKP